MRMNTWSWLLSAAALLAPACTAIDDSDGMVVGSGNMQELTTEAALVRSVAILLPFHTLVYNGEPKQLVVRGEDNLIGRIEVEETAAGRWKIHAPSDMAFEQHLDVELEIPYIEMVEIKVDADHVEFGDQPATVWMSRTEQN